jgi:hypothetical protein
MPYMSHTEREAAVQQERAKYQELLGELGRPSPVPFPEESPEKYARRVLPIVQSVTPGFKDLKIDEYLREPNFKYIENQIFEAARKEARNPTNIPDGELREVKKLDASGRPFYEFHGRASTWLNDFSHGTKKRVVGIKQDPNARYSFDR